MRASSRHLPLIALLAVVLVSGCTSWKRFAYEGFNRDRWQHPDEVVRVLRIAPGATIADIGAGGGYFTFHLADATGPEGTVYAVDVDPGMISYLGERARDEGYDNVETILAEAADPGLPRGGIDLVFLSNTYHHINDRTGYFRRLAADLRPGGRVAIVEFQRKGWLQRLFAHATESEVIRSEMETAGYVVAEQFDFLERQSFLVFARDPQRQ
jgi:ubiquinone/menaquinone biosynthesis C-methylase UbiE